MRNDFAFVVQGLICAQGSEFQKKCLELCLNILACACCCAQELEENTLLLDTFGAYL
jgi:hypothetical protein